ncbi:hypothetical protein EV580_3064 [Mycobacterium sp. BK086]|nr:hypothetical protein EV580_3064 [Mycobacterium sp. BK086]
MDWPVAIDRALTPRDVNCGPWVTVPSGAYAAGQRAQAVVAFHHDEIGRRAAVGLEAVTDKALLHALVQLPWCIAVHTSEMPPGLLTVVDAAPPGVVDRDGSWRIRRLRPPLTVDAVLVGGSAWRSVMGRVAHFAPFCQMIAVFPIAPPAFRDVAWEAAFDGIGVWTGLQPDWTEAIAPRPFRRRAWKAAGWSFHEYAYKVATSMRRVASSVGPVDHRAHITHAVSGLPLAWPTAAPN